MKRIRWVFRLMTFLVVAGMSSPAIGQMKVGPQKFEELGMKAGDTPFGVRCLIPGGKSEVAPLHNDEFLFYGTWNAYLREKPDTRLYIGKTGQWVNGAPYSIRGKTMDAFHASTSGLVPFLKEYGQTPTKHRCYPNHNAYVARVDRSGTLKWAVSSTVGTVLTVHATESEGKVYAIFCVIPSPYDNDLLPRHYGKRVMTLEHRDGSGNFKTIKEFTDSEVGDRSMDDYSYGMIRSYLVVLDAESGALLEDFEPMRMTFSRVGNQKLKRLVIKNITVAGGFCTIGFTSLGAEIQLNTRDEAHKIDKIGSGSRNFSYLAQFKLDNLRQCVRWLCWIGFSDFDFKMNRSGAYLLLGPYQGASGSGELPFEYHTAARDASKGEPAVPGWTGSKASVNSGSRNQQIICFNPELTELKWTRSLSTLRSVHKLAVAEDGLVVTGTFSGDLNWGVKTIRGYVERDDEGIEVASGYQSQWFVNACWLACDPTTGEPAGGAGVNGSKIAPAAVALDKDFVYFTTAYASGYNAHGDKGSHKYRVWFPAYGPGYGDGKVAKSYQPDVSSNPTFMFSVYNRENSNLKGLARQLSNKARRDSYASIAITRSSRYFMGLVPSGPLPSDVFSLTRVDPNDSKKKLTYTRVWNENVPQRGHVDGGNYGGYADEACFFNLATYKLEVEGSDTPKSIVNQNGEARKAGDTNLSYGDILTITVEVRKGYTVDFSESEGIEEIAHDDAKGTYTYKVVGCELGKDSDGNQEYGVRVKMKYVLKLFPWVNKGFTNGDIKVMLDGASVAAGDPKFSIGKGFSIEQYPADGYAELADCSVFLKAPDAGEKQGATFESGAKFVATGEGKINLGYAFQLRQCAFTLVAQPAEAGQPSVMKGKKLLDPKTDKLQKGDKITVVANPKTGWEVETSSATGTQEATQPKAAEAEFSVLGKEDPMEIVVSYAKIKRTITVGSNVTVTRLDGTQIKTGDAVYVDDILVITPKVTPGKEAKLDPVVGVKEDAKTPGQWVVTGEKDVNIDAKLEDKLYSLTIRVVGGAGVSVTNITKNKTSKTVAADSGGTEANFFSHGDEFTVEQTYGTRIADNEIAVIGARWDATKGKFIVEDNVVITLDYKKTLLSFEVVKTENPKCPESKTAEVVVSDPAAPATEYKTGSQISLGKKFAVKVEGLTEGWKANVVVNGASKQGAHYLVDGKNPAEGKANTVLVTVTFVRKTYLIAIHAENGTIKLSSSKGELHNGEVVEYGEVLTLEQQPNPACRPFAADAVQPHVVNATYTPDKNIVRKGTVAVTPKTDVKTINFDFVFEKAVYTVSELVINGGDGAATTPAVQDGAAKEVAKGRKLDGNAKIVFAEPKPGYVRKVTINGEPVQNSTWVVTGDVYDLNIKVTYSKIPITLTVVKAEGGVITVRLAGGNTITTESGSQTDEVHKDEVISVKTTPAQGWELDGDPTVDGATKGTTRGGFTAYTVTADGAAASVTVLAKFKRKELVVKVPDNADVEITDKKTGKKTKVNGPGIGTAKVGDKIVVTPKVVPGNKPGETTVGGAKPEDETNPDGKTFIVDGSGDVTITVSKVQMAIKLKIVVPKPTEGTITVTSTSGTLQTDADLTAGQQLTITVAQRPNYKGYKLTVEGAKEITPAGTYEVTGLVEEVRVSAVFEAKGCKLHIVDRDAHGTTTAYDVNNTLIPQDVPDAVNTDSEILLKTEAKDGYTVETITADGATAKNPTDRKCTSWVVTGEKDVTITVTYKKLRYGLVVSVENGSLEVKDKGAATIIEPGDSKLEFEQTFTLDQKPTPPNAALSNGHYVVKGAEWDAANSCYKVTGRYNRKPVSDVTIIMDYANVDYKLVIKTTGKGSAQVTNAKREELQDGARLLKGEEINLSTKAEPDYVVMIDVEGLEKLSDEVYEVKGTGDAVISLEFIKIEDVEVAIKYDPNWVTVADLSGKPIAPNTPAVHVGDIFVVTKVIKDGVFMADGASEEANGYKVVSPYGVTIISGYPYLGVFYTDDNVVATRKQTKAELKINEPVQKDELILIDKTEVTGRDGKMHKLVVDNATEIAPGEWKATGAGPVRIHPEFPAKGVQVDFDEEATSVEFDGKPVEKLKTYVHHDNELVIKTLKPGMKLMVTGATAHPTKADTYLVDGDITVVVRAGWPLIDATDGKAKITDETAKKSIKMPYVFSKDEAFKVDDTYTDAANKTFEVRVKNADKASGKYTVNGDGPVVVYFWHVDGVKVIFPDGVTAQNTAGDVESDKTVVFGGDNLTIKVKTGMRFSVKGATLLDEEKGLYLVNGNENVVVRVGWSFIDATNGAVLVTDQENHTYKTGDMVYQGKVLTPNPATVNGKKVIIEGAKENTTDGTWEVLGTGDVRVYVEGTASTGAYDLMVDPLIQPYVTVVRFDKNNIQMPITSYPAKVDIDDVVLVTLKKLEQYTYASLTLQNATEKLSYTGSFAFTVKGNVNITGKLFKVYVVPSQFNAVDGADKDNLRVVPNPAVSTLSVEGLTGEANAQIFTSTGLMVKSLLLKPNTQIDVSRFAAGYYILRVNGRAIPFIKQ